MSGLITLGRGEEKKSLAAIKPKAITDFVIEPAEREWQERWKNNALQMSCLPHANSPDPHKRRLPQKAPYDYYYEFPAEGDDYPRKMSIEDRKAGFLYWNCLRRTKGDETQADQQARKKYTLDFLAKKSPVSVSWNDQKNHRIAKNPFMLIGVFSPPRASRDQLC